MGIKVEEADNELYVTVDGPTKITTVEELIAVANVDTEVFEVERFLLNIYPTTMKIDEEVRQVANYQVKGWFRRREPVAISPVVRPIKLKRPTHRKVRAKTPEMGTTLILPDPQIGFVWQNGELIPFHDRRAMELAVQMAIDIRPGRIVLLGDFLDLPNLSDKFIRSPEFAFLTQASVVEGHYWLSRLRRHCPYAEIDMLEGNHDARFIKYMLTHFQQAYNLRPADRLDRPPPMSVPGLLALDDLGINYHGPYPDGRVWITPTLVAQHGHVVRGKKGGTVAAVLTDSMVSVIHGHIHRIESASKTLHLPNSTGGEDIKTVTVHSVGCLCKIDGTVPGREKRQQWQQGLGVVYHTPQIHQIQPVPIENGRLIWNGGIMTAPYDFAEVEELVEKYARF